MILRLSDSLSRGVLVVASVLVTVGVSFFSLRAAVAAYGAESETGAGLELATKLEPGDAEYWYRRAHFQQFNLEQPDPEGATESFRRAIALDPNYTDAWLDLGTSLELDGDKAGAREAFTRAKASYPASAEVSWRLANFLLREGDEKGAYQEFRQALLAEPRRAAATYSRLYRANPNLEKIMDEVLPAEPRVYVDVLGEALGAKQMDVAAKVWARLLTLHPTLGIRDFDRYVNELLVNGEYEDARRVWDQGTTRMNLPPLLAPERSAVWDASFESGIDGSAFAWHLLPFRDGVQTRLDPGEKLSGHQSLRMSFDGKHDPNDEFACSVAVVEPGTNYRFSGWVKTREITTEEGIRFHLRSFGNPEAGVGVTRDVHGTAPWTLIEQLWTAAPKVHRVQICVSRDASDNPDVRISGDAWVDDVNLVPQPVERRKR